MKCLKCGAPISNGAAFCPECGAPTGGYRPPAPAPRKNGVTGAVVALIIVGALILMGLIAFLTWLIVGGGFKQSSPAPETAATQQTEAASAPAGQSAEPATAAPVFNRITASSTRSVDYTSGTAVYYPPENAIDKNYDTCWSPNRNVSLTPTLTLSADTPQHVRGIRISNGYFKTSETYTRNRRITKAEISYNGGRKVVDMPINSYRIMQDIAFDAPADTTYIEIHILDTYYGDWKDICVSEVEVY